MTATLEHLEQQLLSKDNDVTSKYRALFSLRNVASDKAVTILETCLLSKPEEHETQAARDSSALLKHEVAYCLGQIGNKNSVATLAKVIGDSKEHPMVRHEAGEALGALSVTDVAPILEKFKNDPVREVAETCRLALERILFYKQQKSKPDGLSAHSSVDPAPPLDNSDDLSVDEMNAILQNQELPLFRRYRAMFSLRDRGTRDAVLALCESFDDPSALLKHEVAFVLGQMQRREAGPMLRKVLSDKKENIMVRHEAAEALGAITGDETSTTSDDEDDATLSLLREHVHDEDTVVAHSALVALDVADYNNKKDFQYCTVDNE